VAPSVVQPKAITVRLQHTDSVLTSRSRLVIAAAVAAILVIAGLTSSASARAATSWAIQVSVGYSQIPARPTYGIDIRSVLWVETPGGALDAFGFTVAYGPETGNRWHWGWMHKIGDAVMFDSSLNASTVITAGLAYQLRLVAQQSGASVSVTFLVNGSPAQALIFPGQVLSPTGTVHVNAPIFIYGPANVTTLSNLQVQPG